MLPFRNYKQEIINDMLVIYKRGRPNALDRDAVGRTPLYNYLCNCRPYSTTLHVSLRQTSLGTNYVLDMLATSATANVLCLRAARRSVNNRSSPLARLVCTTRAPAPLPHLTGG